jgi:hypothetical protein
MYRKFRDVSFGMVGPRAQFDALEPLTAIQALNQARVLYLQQVVEFNRSQFRLFTALGQPAVCGLDTATTRPVDVPVLLSSPGTLPAAQSLVVASQDIAETFRDRLFLRMMIRGTRIEPIRFVE